MKILYEENEERVVGVIRDAQPTHFTFKIESFSLLSKTSIERYDSFDFEAGGYKWKLAIYPNGNKQDNGEDHISVYLVVSESNSLPLGWEINASFKFLLFNQIQDKYLVLGDIGGKLRRFHAMKTERGFSQIIQLKTFNDPSNGYLVHDNCVFGAEVFVCKTVGKVERLSMLKNPSFGSRSWSIEKFSQLPGEFYSSLCFSSGDHKWKIKLYPRGFSCEKDINLSLFLSLVSTLSVGQRVYAEYKLRVRDQNNNKHIEKKDSSWFKQSGLRLGFPHFMELDILKDKSKGFLVTDKCIIEAEVAVFAVVS